MADRIEKFSFPCPDGTTRTIDIAALFPPGSLVTVIYDYGAELAREFPDVTRSIAAAANAAKREYLRDETVADMIAENRCFEYVGRKLGEQIHRHMLHGEDHGDIWAKARARIIEIASTSGTVNAFVIDNAD